MEAPDSPRCPQHPGSEAIAICSQCDRALCDDCWTHSAHGHPWCLACASEASTRAWRRWSWAVTFLGLAAGVTTVTWRSGVLPHPHALAALGGVSALGVGAYLGYRASREQNKAGLALRTPDDPPETRHAAHPYRARLRQVGMRVVPRVSGKVTTLLMMVSLGLCAVLFPTMLHLPRWVEAEVVLGSWWAAVGLTLATLLYRGVRVADDFRLRLGWSVRGDAPSSRGSSSSSGSGWSAIDLGGDAEGCLVVLGVALVLGLLAGVSFVMAEVMLPLVFAGSYWVMNRAIARVANDRHDCEGDLGRSLRWGLTWSAAYVGPLAVLAWALRRAWQ